jgi:hypothetical protein
VPFKIGGAKIRLGGLGDWPRLEYRGTGCAGTSLGRELFALYVDNNIKTLRDVGLNGSVWNLDAALQDATCETPNSCAAEFAWTAEILPLCRVLTS